MADDISYKIIHASGNQLTVVYKMADAEEMLTLTWDGQGDVDKLIQGFAPRHLLMAKVYPAPDTSALVGRTGIAPAVLEPMPGAETPVGDLPPATEEPPPATQPGSGA